jgi:hypothetical protein
MSAEGQLSRKIGVAPEPEYVFFRRNLRSGPDCCASIGPNSVRRDQFDDIGAVADS